ncbi:MAG: succinate dehydrogenase, hydrophobic membrane anchor protein [Alphaproteobacteria bacterium]|nr:succinate dehydrogenase, hydrophobic membrane anchor protein [Alphaproteobacteria bacterium]
MKLKWDSEGIKSPLARARGLGSAHEGADHWMKQRITAIANIPLVIWFVFSVVSLRGASHAEFTQWLAQPVNAVLAILFIVSTFSHAVLGARVVVEDYIHNEWFKVFKLIGIKLFFVALGVACVFSILKIAL